MFKQALKKFLPFTLSLTLVSQVTFAGNLPSQNPDDYDVQKYQSIYDQTQSQYNQVANQVSQLAAYYQQVLQKFNQAEAVMKQRQDALEQQNRKISDTQGKLDQLNANYQSAQKDRDQVAAQLTAAQNQLAGENQNLTGLNSNLSQAQSKLATAKTDLDDAKASANNATTKLAQYQSEADAAKAAADQASSQLQNLNAQKQKAQQSLDANQSALTENQNALASASKQLDALNANLGVAQKEAFGKEQAAMQAERALLTIPPTDPKFPEAQKRAQILRGEANQAHANVSEIQRSIASTQKDIAAKTQAISVNQSAITAASAQLASLGPQVQSAQAANNSAQAKNNQAQAVLNSFKQDAAPVLAALKTSQAAYDTAQATASQAKSAVDAEIAKTAQIQSNLNALTKQKAQIDATLSGFPGQLASLNSQLSALKQDLPNYQRGVSSQVEVVNQIQLRELRPAQQQLDQASLAAQQLQQQMEGALARLQQVRSNLDQGIQIASADGRADGYLVGSQQGAQQGSQVGARDGADVGNRDGAAKGRADGIQRARDQGAQNGTASGNQAGQAAGAPAGDAKGKPAGQTVGDQDGLNRGLTDGRADTQPKGYADGQQNGHTLGGYDKGRTQGVSEGSARAQQDGDAKGRPEGFAKAVSEFMNTNLDEKTISNRSGSSIFQQMTQSQMNDGVITHIYPHPALTQAYQAAFAQGVKDGQAQAYDQSYKAAYSQAYTPAYQQAYSTALGQNYQSDYNDAYAIAQKAAYDQSYKAAYDQAYKAAYDAAYKAAYDLAYARGFAQGQKDGYQVGFDQGKKDAYAQDFAKGEKDGDQVGYNQTYPNAYAQAIQAGYQDAVKQFSTGSVLQFNGAQLVGANHNGITAPGEALSVSLGIKNFGKIPQKDSVSVQLSDATSGILIDQASVQIIKIPGQTSATVVDVASLRMSSDAVPGKAESVSLTLIEGNKTLGTARLQIQASYPYNVTDVSLDAVAPVGQLNTVNINVMNITQKTSIKAVTVKLVPFSDGITLGQGSLELGQIGAGAVKNAQLSFTIDASAAYQRLELEAQVFEGSILLGKRRMALDSTVRFVSNDSSQGIGLVNDGDSGKALSAAARAAGMSIDILDLRLEKGVSAETLQRYENRILVLSDLNLSADGNSISAIGSALLKSTKVLAMSPNSDQANGDIANAIQKASQGLDTERFTNLEVRERNLFKGDNVSQALIALDLNTGANVSQMARDLAVFAILSQSIDGQTTAYLNALRNGNADIALIAKAAILRTINNEIQDDREIKGNNIRKNIGNSEIAHFVTATLAAQGQDRKALIALYPDLNEIAKDSGGFLSLRKMKVRKVLRPLKKAYRQEG